MELVIVIPAALGGLAAVLFAIGLANGESVTTPQADPVDAVDWATLETRFRTRIGWPEERMAAAFAEYKEFLRLARANPGKIFAPLSDDMDEVWHLHILDSRAYDADCKRIFGRFFHHAPSTTYDEPFIKTAMANTCAYKQEKARRAAGGTTSGGDTGSSCGGFVLASASCGGGTSCGDSSSSDCGHSCSGSSCSGSSCSSCGGGGD